MSQSSHRLRHHWRRRRRQLARPDTGTGRGTRSSRSGRSTACAEQAIVDPVLATRALPENGRGERERAGGACRESPADVQDAHGWHAARDGGVEHRAGRLHGCVVDTHAGHGAPDVERDAGARRPVTTLHAYYASMAHTSRSTPTRGPRPTAHDQSSHLHSQGPHMGLMVSRQLEQAEWVFPPVKKKDGFAEIPPKSMTTLLLEGEGMM